MQVTISANGKNIQVEMSEEQLNELGFAEDKPETDMSEQNIMISIIMLAKIVM